MLIFVLRCIVLLMGVIGVFHTKVGVLLCIHARLHRGQSLRRAPSLPTFWDPFCVLLSFSNQSHGHVGISYCTFGVERLFNFLLFLYDVTTNIVCLSLTAVFAYQSICREGVGHCCIDIHSSDKVSLDMEDPQQQFNMLLVKALISILPAAGFFRTSIFKAAKLEYVVSWNKEDIKGFSLTILLSLGLAATKSLNGRSHGHSDRGRHHERTSSDHLAALLALPDTRASSLHGVLTAESAGVTSDYMSVKGKTCCAG